jgi:hypothetical protein
VVGHIPALPSADEEPASKAAKDKVAHDGGPRL